MFTAPIRLRVVCVLSLVAAFLVMVPLRPIDANAQENDVAPWRSDIGSPPVGDDESGDEVDGRVVGGHVIAAPPWMVDAGVCGGTLIAPQWILTAQHCEDGGVPTFRIGEREERRGVAYFPFDPDRPFNEEAIPAKADLALWRLASPSSQQPLEITRDRSLDNAGAWVYGIGYGDLGVGIDSDGQLRSTGWIRVDGGQPFRSWAFEYGNPGVTTCFGDSGGPVIGDTDRPNGQLVLVGVTAYTTACTEVAGAVKVADYAGWIDSIIADNGGPGCPDSPVRGNSKGHFEMANPEYDGRTLRSGPHRGCSQVRNLFVRNGQRVQAYGPDVVGGNFIWNYVEVARGVEGWIAISRADNSLEVLRPVAPDDGQDGNDGHDDHGDGSVCLGRHVVNATYDHVGLRARPHEDPSDHSTINGRWVPAGTAVTVTDSSGEWRLVGESINGWSGWAEADRLDPHSSNNCSGRGSTLGIGGPSPGAREVMQVISCLAGNGRFDTNIVNSTGEAATYRIEFEGLTARQRSVAPGDWWRLPITGRRAGSHHLRVLRDGVVVSDRTVTFDCDAATPATLTDPEVRVVNACRSGNGYLLFQFVNASDSTRPYVVEFEGVPNRSTSAARFGQSIRAVTGRPNGTWDVAVRSGSQVIFEQPVSVDC